MWSTFSLAWSLVLMAPPLLARELPTGAETTSTRRPVLSEQQPAGGASSIEPAVLRTDYLQFGVGIDSLIEISPGSICPENSEVPCVLGAGVGLTGRAGERTRGPWYFGGTLGFTKIETNSLMRLGVLQHAGVETRYYIDLRKRAEPFLTASLEGVLFGNEWGVDTGGGALTLGFGSEFQIARSTLVGLSINYQAILLSGWVDEAGLDRPTGVAQYWGLHLHFEAHEQLGLH